jgi:hypothetical protein
MSANIKHHELAAIMFSGVIGDCVRPQKPISAPRASVRTNDRTRSSGSVMATSVLLPADFRLCH